MAKALDGLRGELAGGRDLRAQQEDPRRSADIQHDRQAAIEGARAEDLRVRGGGRVRALGGGRPDGSHGRRGRGEVVTKAVSAMAEIEASSHKIGSIIAAIGEITFQTNLLALNAGVEAARRA